MDILIVYHCLRRNTRHLIHSQAFPEASPSDTLVLDCKNVSVEISTFVTLLRQPELTDAEK